MDEVAPDEGDLLKDVALHPRDARSVEDDGEEGDAAEGTRVYAATLNKSVLLALLPPARYQSISRYYRVGA